MALQNSMELEAVLTRVILKLEKLIQERGSWPVVEEAKRTLEQVRGAARQSAKLKAMREKLRSASETVIAEAAQDGALHEDMWDIEDYVDYRT